MWEDFCFYGMRGVMYLFYGRSIVFKMKWFTIWCNTFVYAFKHLLGNFADKVLGFKNLYFLSIVMILGNLIAIAPKECSIMGLLFSIIGTGFLNLNVSMVGELYHEDDPRRDAGYRCFMQELILVGF